MRLYNFGYGPKCPFLKIILCVCKFMCTTMRVYVHRIYAGDHRTEKKILDSLELELTKHVTPSHGNQSWVLSKTVALSH